VHNAQRLRVRTFCGAKLAKKTEICK